MKKGTLATHIPPNPKIIIGEQNIYRYPGDLSEISGQVI